MGQAQTIKKKALVRTTVDSVDQLQPNVSQSSEQRTRVTPSYHLLNSRRPHRRLTGNASETSSSITTSDHTEPHELPTNLHRRSLSLMWLLNRSASIVITRDLLRHCSSPHQRKRLCIVPPHLLYWRQLSSCYEDSNSETPDETTWT